MQRIFIAIVSAVMLWLVSATDARAAQTFASAGTPMNSPHNYTWNRMTTINVNSGQIVPFIAYQFHTIGAPAGNYTFTMNTVGFPGAINIYQGSFDPTQPGVNFYDNGVVAGAAGTISKTVNLIAGSFWEVVFSAANAGNAGTYSATITGPGNVTVTVVTNTQIRVGPGNPTISSGQSANLGVYAIGPLPHTWQWYGGPRPNSTLPIAGATTPNYNTGPLINNTSYWVRVIGPGNSGSVTSSTANVTVTGNPNANYSGTLAVGGCVLQNGNLYNVQRFQIQQQGNYVFNITPGFTLTTYQGSFDAANPNANLWGVLNGFYAVGTYELVISKASPGGAFSGAIGGGPAIVNLLTSLPPAFVSSPIDTTILSGQSATLRVSTTCGTPFTLQWFRGQSGDTSNPIAGATGFGFTTPALTASTTYWVRMIATGVTNNSAAATVFIGTNPVQQGDVLASCDRRFDRPATATTVSGLNCVYKPFVFRVSTSGTYTFSLASSGFSGRLQLYSGVFSPSNPLVNLESTTGSVLRATITAGPNYNYLVVSGTNPNDAGNFTVSVTEGPSLVTLYPSPAIPIQPAGVNVPRGQTATLNVTSPTPGLSYQWYTGASCGTRIPISGATASSFVTPAVVDYVNYWVELTGVGGYTFSDQITAGVMPQAVTDSATVSEDSSLVVPPPGLLANDIKANSRTLSGSIVTQPAHGSAVMEPNGAFGYTPAANYHGPDSFTYQVTDGTLTSAPGTVNITVTPVADTPSITSATTSPGQRTTNGLVISRSAADGTEVSHFKITGITNGQLFQNDGTTPIANNQFITFAQGNAGLRFTPILNPAFPGFGFTIQASTSAADAGLGGATVAASVTVTTPGIVTQPANIVACVGNTASFSVEANIPGATYQWQRRVPGGTDFVNIDGAISANYTTPPVTPADDGAAYRVRVGTSIFSSSAILSVITAAAPTATYNFEAGLPPNTAIYGSAFLSGGVLELNSNTDSQTGAFLTGDLAPGRVVRGFTATFQMRLEPGTFPPADGFSFNWASDLPNGTYAVAEEGEGSGLRVCFDTWDNGEGEGPAVDVWWGPNLVARRSVTIPFLARGAEFNDVRIRLTPDGLLDVSYACESIFARLPVIGYVPQLNSRFGLGSRTGGAWESHSLDNLSLQLDLDPAIGVPRITSVVPQSPSGVLLTGTGPAGEKLAVEASSDLVTWIYRFTVTANAAGVWQFLEPNTTTPPERFYRLATAAQFPPGLVNWWRAENSYADSIGGLRGMPINGLGFAPGQRGASFDFNGTNQALELGGTPLTVPWTACFWVNRADAIDPSAALIADASTGLKLEQWQFTRQAGFTQFGVADYFFNTIVPTDTWTHVAFVGTQEGTILFINGDGVEINPATINLPRGILGALNNNGGDHFKGRLDEVTLFNRALNATEIQQVRNASRGP